jgi:hypothetical protein
MIIPATPAGELAVAFESELTVKPAAAVFPNETAVAPVKLLPLITT